MWYVFGEFWNNILNCGLVCYSNFTSFFDILCLSGQLLPFLFSYLSVKERSTLVGNKVPNLQRYLCLFVKAFQRAFCISSIFLVSVSFLFNDKSESAKRRSRRGYHARKTADNPWKVEMRAALDERIRFEHNQLVFELLDERIRLLDE